MKGVFKTSCGKGDLDFAKIKKLFTQIQQTFKSSGLSVCFGGMSRLCSFFIFSMVQTSMFK